MTLAKDRVLLNRVIPDLIWETMTNYLQPKTISPNISPFKCMYDTVIPFLYYYIFKCNYFCIYRVLLTTTIVSDNMG